MVTESTASREALLLHMVVNDAARLLVRLARPRPGKEVVRWEEVEVAAVCPDHLGLSYDIRYQGMQDCLTEIIAEAVEAGRLPRRVTVPRYAPAAAGLFRGPEPRRR